jgi:transcriptional regulator with PAS, ATPase and Fis domain
LITGENGTGKELVAQNIHYLSPRAGRPFVEVNCAAIPEELFESELFGHKKGSFTGAITDKPGLWEAAMNGTLFLDEIGDMPLYMQAKILRVLEEKKLRNVGDTTDKPVNARVICASHKSLLTLVADSKFREDLYWRLVTFTLAISPLRLRPGDIPLIVKSLDKDKILLPETITMLASRELSGNVRELKAVVRHIQVLGREK